METKTKKREWVKNAAIIFLAVLLILTFFSNTILNASLPEVATREIHGGSVTARIRGTGSVTANQNYQVTVEQSRKVKTVMVKQGQEVSAGDVLFVLADMESAELEQARDALRQLQKSYQEKLINGSDKDYARENRDIQLARDALAEAQADRDRLLPDAPDLDQAKLAAEEAKGAVAAAERLVEDLKDKVAEAQEAVTQAQTERDEAGTRPNSDTLNTLKTALETKRKALSDASNALESAMLIHRQPYEWMRGRAEMMIKQTNEYRNLPGGMSSQRFIEGKLPTYLKYVKELIEDGQLFPYDTHTVPTEFGQTLAVNSEEVAKYAKAYNDITAAQDDLSKAQEEYDDAQADYNRTLEKNEEYNRLQQKVDAAKAALEAAKAAQRDAEYRQKDAQDRKNRADETLEQFKTAEENIKTAEKNLQDLLFSLQEQQRTDVRQGELDSLELRDLSAQIANAQHRVDELSDTAADAEIKAAVNGTIGSVDITAGQTTTPNSPLATIELPDMGYGLSFSVTNDQARRVRVGDAGTVSNIYWGNQIDAVLTTIKTDPKDPQNQKLLTFELHGDVSPGSNLTVSVGQRSADYDFVVPNSALRSDSNGDFILVVVEKASPLGDRYTATRVDVTKLANDDTSTAVTGALNAGDFVITTSTAPIKNGDRVRLADNQNTNGG